jgi:hypothetical protein
MKTSRLVISVAVYDFLILKRKNEEKSFFFLVADRRNPDSVETNLHHHVLQIICSSFTGERQCREKTQGVKAHRIPHASCNSHRPGASSPTSGRQRCLELLRRKLTDAAFWAARRVTLSPGNWASATRWASVEWDGGGGVRWRR